MSVEKIIYDTAAIIVPVKVALLVVCQSKHETENYTSNDFINDHNCYGYKFVPKSIYGFQLHEPGRISTEGDAYAKYKSPVESTQEMCAWLIRHIPYYTKLSTVVQYAMALKVCNYYGAPFSEYAHGMKEYYKPVIR